MEITLPARPPFSLYSVIHSHGWIRLHPFREEGDSSGMAYLAQLDSGQVVELHIQETPNGVDISFDSELNADDCTEIERAASWMLGLDQDFSAFYQMARQEPRLANAAQRAQGRILRSPTLFEDVIKTILTTNTLWAATIRMNNNLVSQFGAQLPTNPTRRAFPSPARLAETDEETLRAQTRLGYRAPYVLDLARKVNGGELDLEALKTADLPTSELRKSLLAIKGIGNYAAANLLMLLGHYDYVPVDSWALKMVSQEWHGGEPVSQKDVEAAFEQWGAYKGLAYWLWDWSKG